MFAKRDYISSSITTICANKKYLGSIGDSINLYDKILNIYSYKIFFIYYTGYLTVKILRYIESNSVNVLNFIINKINGYIEESNGNRYLTLVPPDKSKCMLKVWRTTEEI